MSVLTSNDAAVLQALFDNESSPSAAIKVDSNLSPFPERLNITSEDYESLRNRERSISEPLQVDSDDNVSQETIQSTIKALDALIDEHPTYPPAYANRAQAFRMLIDNPCEQTRTPEMQVNDQMFDDPANTITVSRLFSDLGQVISLSTPPSPADPVSPAQTRALAVAYTHRGYLLLKAARARRNGRSLETKGSEHVWELGSDQLEEMASRDFFFGGRYGNKIAQQLAVRTNPYAKMCGAIVKEAMKKEVEEIDAGVGSSVYT